MCIRDSATVQACRGSHTHTLVTDPNDEENIYVYIQGTSGPRPSEELAGCSDAGPEDPNTSLFRIEVVRIPIDAPEEAEIVSLPRLFADAQTGNIAALWSGGDHGPGTQETSGTNRCHDITAYPEIGLAAGACSGNGILLDISDPSNPIRLHEVVDPNFAYWHSATFNNDGDVVVFTDEWGGGSRPRCRAVDPMNWGADAIYDIVDGQLEFRSYYKLPAPQTDQENCVAHNGSIIPVPGRDIFAQAWYQGGMSLVDFTDSSNPVEIAYFDRGPIHEKHLIGGGYWSTYWYNGKIYGTEITRGLDIFALLPSEYLTENEVAAALLADQGELFNPQQQFRVTWPDVPVVARAYMDQLARNDGLDEQVITALNSALDRADSLLDGNESDSSLAASIEELAAGLDTDNASSNSKRAVLANTLNGIAMSLTEGR